MLLGEHLDTVDRYQIDVPTLERPSREPHRQIANRQTATTAGEVIDDDRPTPRSIRQASAELRLDLKLDRGRSGDWIVHLSLG